MLKRCIALIACFRQRLVTSPAGFRQGPPTVTGWPFCFMGRCAQGSHLGCLTHPPQTSVPASPAVHARHDGPDLLGQGYQRETRVSSDLAWGADFPEPCPKQGLAFLPVAGSHGSYAGFDKRFPTYPSAVCRPRPRRTSRKRTIASRLSTPTRTPFCTTGSWFTSRPAIKGSTSFKLCCG